MVNGPWTREAVLAVIVLSLAAGQVEAQSGGQFLRNLVDQAAAKAKAQVSQSAKSDDDDDEEEAKGQEKVDTPLGRQGLEPMGYSAKFAPVRERIEAGDFDGVLPLFPIAAPSAGKSSPAAVEPASTKPTRSAKPAATATTPVAPTIPVLTRDQFLANVEAGTIEFEAGRFDQAVARLTLAEAATNPIVPAEARGAAATFQRFKQGAANMARQGGSLATGRGELGPYPRRDHEAILQLNYLALSYLIQGDRRSYNVTRRAIDQQKDLKLKFDAQLEAYKAKYAEQKKAEAQAAAQAAADPNAPKPTARPTDGVQTEIAKFDGIADLVPNAYVNPLGDYLAGVIQEIAAREQPPLRDNAVISYAAAASLAGQSPQMTAAAASLRRPRIPADERVLHVVVGEGFAPSRKVLAYGFDIQGTRMVARVPIFAPTASAVATLELRSAKGARLARLDPIGNFEAIVLRDQRDRMPQILLGVAATTTVSYGQAQMGAKAGGALNLLAQFKRANESPDTRSWSSLPRRFHVARLVIPTGATKVQLVSLDVRGRVIATVSLSLDSTKAESFVYARATDHALKAAPARTLWIDGRLGPHDIRSTRDGAASPQ